MNAADSPVGRAGWRAAAVAAGVALAISTAAAADPPDDDPRAAEIRRLMEAAESLENVLFRDVVRAATGFEVIEVRSKDSIDRAMLDHLSAAADGLVAWLNGPDSGVRGLRRINEASAKAEDRLRALLNRGDFRCTLPENAAGVRRRPGYPDLRLIHGPSGRVTLIDPKLFEGSAEASTLRTFYYEPRTLTGKIRENARHVLLGISHDGRDGMWTFTGWEMVDLYGLRVRLKAEFQSANRDLYRSGLRLRKSQPPKKNAGSRQ